MNYATMTDSELLVVVEAKHEWRRHAFQLVAFLDECTVPETGPKGGASVPLGELMIAFNMWRKEQGLHGSFAQKTVRDDLKASGYKVGKGEHGVSVYGIRLREGPGISQFQGVVAPREVDEILEEQERHG